MWCGGVLEVSSSPLERELTGSSWHLFVIHTCNVTKKSQVTWLDYCSEFGLSVSLRTSSQWGNISPDFIATNLTMLETHYNALKYNANSVITQSQSWLPIFQGLTSSHGMNSRPWEQLAVRTAGRDQWSSETYRPVAAVCNRRRNDSAAESTSYVYVQRSSPQEGEGWVMSNV